jgi:hypothetical protein
MAITETIGLDDRISAAANSAASAVDGIAHAFAKAREASIAAAVAAQKAAAAINDSGASVETQGEALIAAAKAHEGAVLAAQKAEETKANAAAKALEQQRKKEQQIAKAQEKAAQASKKAAIERRKAVRDTLEIGKNVLEAGKKVFEFARGIIDTAVQFERSRRAGEGLLNILTKGKGKEALAGLTRLSDKLGIKLETATGQFQQFREAGLDNRQSIALIKLAADIEAVAPGSGLAEQAISKVLEKAKTGGDVAGEMNKLADAMGVVGDGSNAAAASAFTLEGRMNRISEKASQLAARLAEAVAPALEGLVDQFLFVADEGIAPFQEAWGVFSQDTEAQAAVADAAVAIMTAGMVTNFTSIIDSAAESVSAIEEQASAWVDAGIALVEGFIEGIKAKAAEAIAEAGAMATGAVDAVRGALDIGSPSKVLMQAGEFAAEGFTMGIEDFPSAQLSLPEVPGIASGGGSSTVNATVNINISGSGKDESTLAREIRREIQMYFNQLRYSGV